MTRTSLSGKPARAGSQLDVRYQVNPFSDEHCVCSFEKNYRLQDIQLSKIC